MNRQIKRYPAASQDLLNHITRANADQQLHVIIDFAGRIDAGRLERALRLCLEREPVLGCRFVIHGSRVYWERRTDLEQIELSRVVMTGEDDREWLAFVTQPNDPAVDPLVQARIFRGPHGDRLGLKVDHVAADGAGTKAVAYLVADTYRRLEADPDYRPAPGTFGPRSQAAFLRQAGLRNLIRYRPRVLSLPPMQFSLPFVGTEPSGRRFATRHFSADQFRALMDFAHCHGVTLNDLILTALYRAMFSQAEAPQHTPLPVQVSLDLRRYLPVGKEQGVCNLSGALFPAVEYIPGRSFEQVLADVSAQMGRWKSRRPGLTGAMLIELSTLQGYAKAKARFAAMTRIRSNRVSPMLLSNFGVLDEQSLAFGSLAIRSAWMLGPVMFGHGLMLTASTYAEELTLAIGSCAGCIAEETIERLLGQVWQEMAGLVQAGEAVSLQPAALSAC